MKSIPAKKSILVVEDEDSLRMAMAMVFRHSGYRVFQAANGTAALEIVKREPLDLIISDVRMPHGDGVNLLKDVRRMNHERPVLMLVSGYTDLKNEDAYDLGADAIFPKPFDRDALLRAVKERLLSPAERWFQDDLQVPAGLLQVRLRVASLDYESNFHILRFGRGGFFVAMDANFPPPEVEVEFFIQIDSGAVPSIEGFGLVRWTRYRPEGVHPAGCGIEFKSIQTESLAIILQTIARLNAKAFIPKS